MLHITCTRGKASNYYLIETCILASRVRVILHLIMKQKQTNYDHIIHRTHTSDQTATDAEKIEWTDLSGKVSYGARTDKDVLLIVSEDDLSHPDVVPRRPAIELTQELREKLENQGIARDQQTDDLTIMKARYGLTNNRKTIEVEMSQPGGERVTRESVLKHITTLMDNHDDRAGGGKKVVLG